MPESDIAEGLGPVSHRQSFTCALHFAHYNFCRVHSSLWASPAMDAGVTSEFWLLEAVISWEG